MAIHVSDRAYAALYLVTQRLRRGVTSGQIDEAAHLLEASAVERQEYLERRLFAQYGAGREWLARQPVMDRDSLAGPMAELLVSTPGRLVEHRKTSGSTGAPFKFIRDRAMTAWMDAAMWAGYAWHGIMPGHRQARFWGMPLGVRERLVRRVTDRLQHRRRLSAFDVTPSTCRQFLMRLNAFRPTYIYGYPTLIGTFVDQCRQQGLDGRRCGVRVAVVTGELLLPTVRQAIGDFFGCTVVNEYGCTESGVLALECERGTLHTIPAAVHVELLLDGVPAPEGEVVSTDLYGAIHPLVRYRLRDRARWTTESCPCGRDLPGLVIDAGRVDSFIITPARGKVYDAVIAYAMPAGVQRFQARQPTLGLLEVDIVPGRDLQPDALAACQTRLRAQLGPGMEIAVRLVGAIPSDPSGKLRYFIPLRAGQS